MDANPAEPAANPAEPANQREVDAAGPADPVAKLGVPAAGPADPADLAADRPADGRAALEER